MSLLSHLVFTSLFLGVLQIVSARSSILSLSVKRYPILCLQKVRFSLLFRSFGVLIVFLGTAVYIRQTNVVLLRCGVIIFCPILILLIRIISLAFVSHLLAMTQITL